MSRSNTQSRAMFHPPLVILVSWACFIDLGCMNGDNSNGAETAAQSDTGSTGAEQTCPKHVSVDACCCFGKPDSGIGFNTACDAVSLCPRVGIQCQNGLEECTVKVPPEDIRCLLEALAARDSGSLTWVKTSLTAPWGVDEITEQVKLYISGESAFQVRMHFDPEWTKVEEVLHFTLKPVDFFKQCLEELSLEAQMSCVENAFESASALSCLDPYAYPRI